MRKTQKKDIGERSLCPISCSLEVIGDKWSLLIIRDMIFAGKSTYNEFLESEEGIATNILNDRLKKLTESGILTFSGGEKRKKYALTEKGLDLKPVIESIGAFGIKYFKGSKEYMEERLKTHVK